jgi:signal transduction histidine kinase
LTPGQALDKLDYIQETATTFIWEMNLDVAIEPIDWDHIVIDALNISEETFYTTLKTGASIAELSLAQDVDPEYLMTVILDAEEESLREVWQLSEKEVTWQLREIAESAAFFIDPNVMDPENALLDYVHLQGEYAFLQSGDIGWTEAGVDWLVNALLLRNQRLLVADDMGWVVYDSANSHVGQRLSYTMLEQGVSLWDDETDELAGTLIITASADYYSTYQSAFLKGVNRALLFSGVLAGLIALGIGLLVARRVTAPVSALTAAAQQMADGDWAARVPHPTNTDELGQMSVAFNTMAAALETQRDLRNRLVNDVAHELNTPLSVIQAELEAFQDNLQTPEEAAIHVEREIGLLRNLVNDLALLAEADEGRLHLHIVTVDFAQLAAQAVARWTSQAMAAGIRLTLEPASTPLPPVQADPLRVAQILGNLLSNAIQHTPRGGSITVQCAHDPNSQHLVTTVRDTGTGIAEADLPFIFERFYRADKSRNRRTGGRGLGLVVVKSLVEGQGWQIWVESTLGTGRFFRFTLPVED